MSKSFRELVELLNKKKRKGEELKPVSKGEQDFAKMHRVEITPHPHADDKTVNARGVKKAKHEEVEYVVEDVAAMLQKIAKSNKNGDIVFENKDSVPVDPRLAKRMVEAMSKMKTENVAIFKKKINTNIESFMKMVDMVERGAKR